MNKEKDIAKKKKELEELEEKKKKEVGKGNISKYFGANPNEVDGKTFQQKVRKEWE